MGGRHVLGRWQVGEWRGWVGRHTAGLGLCPVAGAGTAQHMTGQEEDGERQWGQSAALVFPRLDSARLRLKESRLRLDSDL